MTGNDAIGGTIETWQIRKPAVESRHGIVASQHFEASQIGARVLAEGGNAVDAAVAAGVAIGTVEPWMSGLGGGGHMLVYLAAENRAFDVDFGMRAPRALNPDDYPLVSGTDSDLFGWPAVLDNRNVVGPYSFAVPGFVAGMATALERFGTRSWRDSLAPAIALARRDMNVDWYATLKIAAAAPQLRNFVESARVYLPGGHVPAGEWGGPVPRITLGSLAATLARLAHAGPRDFYEGRIAAEVVSDAEKLGSSMGAADLAEYQARIVPAQSFRYRDAHVHAATQLTAGPTLRRTLEMLADCTAPGASPGAAPDAAMYAGFADSLLKAYAERLEGLGDEGEAAAPTCTTHMSVVDGEGNMVALTQTLLSVFGSKVVLPTTGILMNNGIMWLDPRPGRPNSLAPGRRPLTNMCPTVVDTGSGLRIALGASGGRRIMPAVMQLISFLVDFGMSVDDACHQPRLDVSGTPLVTVDARLPTAISDHLAERHQVIRAQHGVYPALFACPNLVARDESRGMNVGGAFVMSPWSKAVAAG